MSSEPKRSGKTEVLSMRLDPKTRFLVDVVAKVRGQSISTVVERAILEVADSLQIGNNQNWRHYWSISEGVRALNMAAEPNLYPNYEEESRLEFAKRHWQFFYNNEKCTNPRTAYIDVLWPMIDNFLDLWERTKAREHFAAGKAMQKALRDADIQPPEWPPQAPPKAAVPPKATGPSWDAPKGGDLDDEIPF